MDALSKEIKSNYPFFLKTKEGYYRAYSYKIDDEILNALTEMNKIYPLSYKRFIHNYHYDNIYVIGDIHSDYNVLLEILLKQKFIIKTDKYYEWNHELKNTCIIQIGDFLHGYGKRASPETFTFFKPQELEIVRLFKHLIQTETNNNKLIVLLGNHEFMNITKKYNTGKVLYANELYELLSKQDEENEINSFIIENCEVCCYINNFMFTHAGITRQIIKKIFGFLKYPKVCYDNLTSIDKIRIINITCIAYMYIIFKEIKIIPLNEDKIINSCMRVFYSKLSLYYDNSTIKTIDIIINDKILNDADLIYLRNKQILLTEIYNHYIDNDKRFYYIKQLKTYDKIDSMFRNEINETFAYNKMFLHLNKNTYKYVKLLFSSTSSKSAGLLSNYQFSLSKENIINANEVFNFVINELSNIRGIVIGHSPQKDIIMTFNDNLQVLINIDNLISIGQNQKDVIRQYNFDGSIIYKEAKILHIDNNSVEQVSIKIDKYQSLIDNKININKVIILTKIIF